MRNKINILIIGFGSIGRRHAEVLSNQKFTKNIFIFSKNSNHNFKKIKKINKANLKNIDYVIIANRTNEHFSTLKKINKILKNIIILVEKPLFDKSYKPMLLKNKVFVGYNMRFNPIISYIKQNIKKQYINKISISSHSNLKYWRKNLNYSKSESAKRKGGVLHDYSHEIDFLNWIFGKMRKKFVLHKKISDLKIESKDTFIFIGYIKNILIQLDFNFFSKQNSRLIKIDQKNLSFEFDLIKKSIKKFTDKGKNVEIVKNFSRNSVYLKMHKDILFSKNKKACTYKEGLHVNNFLGKF